MRLFIGIPLASDVADALQALSRHLQSIQDGFRWSSPQSWHITLQFLGEASAETEACLVANLKEVRSPSLLLSVDGTGFFNSAGIFFAGVRQSLQLAGLYQKVIAATSQCGFVAESRPFHPHITLARARGHASKQAIRRLQMKTQGFDGFPSFIASEFYLYQVFLSSEGSRYEIRERFPLVEG